MDDKGKVFQLAPPDVDLSTVIPDLRISVWKIRDLEPSCKVVFGCICESAFSYKFKLSSPGIVRRSKVAVAHACGLSCDTVRRAVLELTRRRFLATTVCWDGLGEMTYWFIAGAATQRELDQAYDEATGRTMRLARRPHANRGNDGKFTGGKPGKPTETGQISERHGVSQPSGRCKSATEAGQVSHRSGASQPSGRAVTPSGRLTDTVSMADLARGDGGETPLTRNVEPSPMGPKDGGGGGKAPPPIASQGGNGEKEHRTSLDGDALAGYEEEIRDQIASGVFPSRFDKLRTQINAELRTEKVRRVRDFLIRKRNILNRVLDGPQPPSDPNPAPEPASAPAKAKSEPKPPTEEELVAGAEYLVSVGKLESGTKAMREAYARHLETEAAKSKLLPKKGKDHANPT